MQIELLKRRGSGVVENVPDAYLEARTMKEEYLALCRKLDYEKACGALIPADKILLAWQRLVGAFRSRCLAIPARLAPQLVSNHDINDVKELLATAIREALDELSRYEFTSDNPGSGEGSETTAQADDKRVGKRKPQAKLRG